MERPTPTSEGWEWSAGWLAGVLLLAIGASGCSPNRVSVATERLPDVLRLADGESVVLEEDGEKIVVRPGDDPSLWVRLAPQCSTRGEAFARDRCGPLHVPLRHVRVEGDELHLDAYEGSIWMGARKYESMALRAEDVQSIALQYDPADRVHFGVSLVVLGPSRLAGVQLQLLPKQWLALEAGLIGVADAAFFLWSGLRVRPVEWGRMRPFIGAFVNYGGTGAVELSYGPRLGLDIDVTRWFMLTLEADGLRVEDAGGIIRSAQAGTWSATGGLAISTIF